MLPIAKIVWHEFFEKQIPARLPEPSEAMEGIDQVKAYVKAYEWGGPTSALQLHHIKELSVLIRPGDLVVDLACGPGSLILELADLYPDCHFVGADLSDNMLEYLIAETSRRGLKNLTTIKEDITKLESIKTGSVDLVISTSALHHLPDEKSLAQAFRRTNEILKSNGGFYFSDFGLLRSRLSREYFVAEVAKLAPPLTSIDYDFSLQAAFPIKAVFDAAKLELPKPFNVTKSSLIDILYFLQSNPRAKTPASVRAFIKDKWRGLSFFIRMEHWMLRWLTRTRRQN